MLTSISKTQQKSKNLDEVSFIRPILIILLVLMHSFTVFNGVWPEFVGYQDCITYKWIARSSYSFLLESFAFISGYVWAFQCYELNKLDSFKNLVYKKINRLIWPSILFSLLYLEFFEGGLCNAYNELGCVKCLIYIISGVGHLWFLPVLFWCFVLTWMFEKVKSTDTIKYVIILILSVAPLPALVFQFSHVPYYLLFFYSGFLLRKYINLKNRICKWRILLLWPTYVILFILFSRLQDCVVPMISSGGLLNKALFVACSKMCKLIYSYMGTLALYVTAVTVISNYKLKDSYISIGKLCFGVYIYQEFILRYIFYHTNLSQEVSYLLVPWIGFIVVLILSTFFTAITKKI